MAAKLKSFWKNNFMHLLEIAKRRKTVRHFKSKEVSLEDMLYCIEVAKEAPSGMNSQPWRFVIITDDDIKKNIRKICEKREKEFHEKLKGKLKEWLKEKHIIWKKNFIEEAPILLLIFSSKEFPYFVQSTWLAIGYLLLALEEKGLATVTYTPPNPEEVRKYIGAPDEYKLEAILPIGYSADEKEKEERKNLEEITYLNEWKQYFKYKSHILSG